VRYTPRSSRGAGAPRALLLGIGLFVITLGVLAAVLFTNGDDDNNSPTPLAAVATSTSGASPTVPVAAVVTATLPPTTTAAPTATNTAAVDPTETPTETSDDPTPTDEPATEEPTETVQTPTVPSEGEFGALPPVEIPSGGLARPLTLSYELGLSLDDIPSEGDVYQLQWPERTADDVTALATALGITGDVADQGDGVFSVDGDGGSLYAAPDVVQISLDPAPANGGLADDATSIDAARTWLLDNGLVGDDIGDGSVISKDANAARATVYFSTDAASPLLAAYPSARVTVGPGGAIYEAYVKWPVDYAVATYQLVSAEDLWAAVQAGQGYLEADLSSIPGEGPVSGTLTVTSVSLAYSTADGDDGEYLAPIVVFSGEAVLDDSGASVPVSVYLPAVAGQSAPRG
jgi:hypothetical protein